MNWKNIKQFNLHGYGTFTKLVLCVWTLLKSENDNFRASGFYIIDSFLKQLSSKK